MADKALLLYYSMTERLSDHRSASGGAYPEKFVLNPQQHDEYLRCVAQLRQFTGKAVNPESHMGVRIEIDVNSPGVMVATDGSEVSLQ